MGGGSMILLFLSLTVAASTTLSTDRKDNDDLLKILPQDKAAALKNPLRSPRDASRSAYSRLRSRHRLPRSDQLPVMNFAQQMNELMANVAVLTTDVARLSDQNKAFQEVISNLQSQNSALEAKLAQSAQTVQQQDAAVQALSARVATLEGEMGQTTQKQNASVQQLTNELTGVRSQISGIEFRQNTSSINLSQQSAKIVDLTQRMRSTESKTIHLEETTGNLAKSLFNVTAGVTALNTTQRELANDVNGLEGKEQHLSVISSDLQTDVNQLTHKLESSTRSVVFYARLSENTHRPFPLSPFPIIMDEIVTNQGQAYNATSGSFTVPVDGDYFFTATAMPERPQADGTPRIQLMLDDANLFLTDSNHPTVQAALRLHAGQRVWLRSLFTSAYGKNMYFSGFLINTALPE